MAVSPSVRRSRTCRGRAPPCSSPPPLAAEIVAIDGSSRCACVWGTRRCRRVRRRSHRRRTKPPAVAPPLFPSLTSGPRSSVSDAEAGVQLGPRRRLGPRLCARGPPLRGLAQLWPSCFSDFVYLFISQIYVYLEKYVAPSI